ncbi:hypothetical protein AYK25_02200 [Thermoplasmatales archaeon SM1-50]|nr:MAG: hypothetical protein AYK25_02200 [Thermoplasmatales archaeon SM1-50]
MKASATIILGLFLLCCSLQVHGIGQEQIHVPSAQLIVHQSYRTPIANAVVAAESDPFFSLIGTSVACWYDSATNTSGLLPLLISHAGNLTASQARFLASYLSFSNTSVLVIGEHLNTTHHTIEILGSAPSVAIALATEIFLTAPTVLILPYGINTDLYHLSLLASPLASYLNIPILLYDNNEEALEIACTQLHTTQAYLVGDSLLTLPNVTITSLPNEEAITETVLSAITIQFGSINYLAMTNPSDVIPPEVINTTTIMMHEHITNKKIIILSKKLDIVGNDTCYASISIPDGINHIQISGEISQKHGSLFGHLSPIDPLIFIKLFDAHGQIIAYANSMGYDVGKTYLETLTCNASGPYNLEITVYYGIKGGFYIQRGLSFVDADITINITISTLGSPHIPVIPKLSNLAPYLTAAHGGLLIANASWELTDISYVAAAQGFGAGPWYTEPLHLFTNEKVNTTVQQLKMTLDTLEAYDLLNGYLNGPAWLAILADTTMIPMYYYGPSQGGIPERGLPSDNPYSLGQNLSVGRLISWDVYDVSVLIARTFFYEPLCGTPEHASDWHHRFSFIFGEGFGETGGLFHQIPYAREIRDYNFSSKVYGIFRNSRQFIERFYVFTAANYIEYLGHGDWFWFPASFYGFDMYSKAVDVAHAKDWVYDKPSVFLTSACLVGRTDGLPPQMNIGLAMLHAGCNAFVGATRETGQESGLTVLENHLIVDDWSIGEALRGEKRIDAEPPTFFVRVLYGDPAFNPYEPLHGFSSQGRPILKEL